MLRIHHLAYRSSRYLQTLLQHDAILPEPNERLDSVYKLPTTITSPSRPSDLDSSPPTDIPNYPETASAQVKHELLLTRDAVPGLLKAFDIADGSTAAGDLYRAVEQARLRIKSGRSVL